MKKSFFRLAFSLTTFLFAVSAMAQDQLTIEGTGDSQTLLRHLAKKFEQLNPKTKIIVPDSIGSSGGIKALHKGKCKMARVARPLKEEEKTADLSYHKFAYSPVVFTANLPEKCIDNLSSDQIVGIFSGTISNWSELGNCKPHKIYVATREFGDSSRSIIEKKVAGFKAIPQMTGKVIYSTPETLQTLEETPYAIGFLPLGSTSSKLQVFAFNGVVPKEPHVQDGVYPLASPFGLAWKGELSDLGSRFLTFLSSSAGMKITRSLGVVPVPACQQ